MYIVISERIKELRESKGLTQADLAKKIHVTRSSVNSWEMGLSTPSIDKIIDLARLFHVSTDYILGVADNLTINVDNLEPDELEIIHKIMTYFDKPKPTK